jgi:nucleoside-diphosphate-sugar epimerase
MMAHETPEHHALVIGASGLIGWSVVNQLLQPYPTPSPFRKVTALVNRPLELEDSYWPNAGPGNPELALASGANLMCEDDEFARVLKQKVEDINSVSHVFYFGTKRSTKERTLEADAQS